MIENAELPNAEYMAEQMGCMFHAFIYTSHIFIVIYACTFDTFVLIYYASLFTCVYVYIYIYVFISQHVLIRPL